MHGHCSGEHGTEQALSRQGQGRAGLGGRMGGVERSRVAPAGAGSGGILPAESRRPAVNALLQSTAHWPLPCFQPF
jgi:hypothetical protein